MTDAWYDTLHGLSVRLSDGLSGLHEIRAARNAAYYERQEDLEEWLLLGRWWLDRCGNFALVTDGAPADLWPYLHRSDTDLPNVMTRAQTLEISPRWTASFFVSLPESGDTCERCGKGWTVDDLHDAYAVGNHGRPMHRGCRRLQVVQWTYDELSEILTRAEITVLSKRLIPSRYHDDDLYFGPWMVVETPRGRLEIGHRKRVIHIQWPKSWKVPTDVFSTEDVTKWENGIHAWNDEKAIEYLRKAWSHGST